MEKNDFSLLITGILKSDNDIEGGMTALPIAMATRNWVLPTVKALKRALRQAEFD